MNKTINWKPASTGTGRFGNWLANANDWNLSRSRYWGIPIPIWTSEDRTEQICISSIEQLKEEAQKAEAQKAEAQKEEAQKQHQEEDQKILESLKQNRAAMRKQKESQNQNGTLRERLSQRFDSTYQFLIYKINHYLKQSIYYLIIVNTHGTYRTAQERA